MSFKALNDSVGPNGLVPILLVFGAYPCMTEIDTHLSIITQWSVAMRKAMEELRKSNAFHQVNVALNTWNRPSTSLIHNLPLNSPVLVFREGNTGQSGSWQGLYKLLSLESESAVIKLSNGPTKFRSTLIKPYYDLAIVGIDKNADKDIENSSSENGDIFEDRDTTSVYIPPDISLSSVPLTSLAPPAIFAPIKHWHGRLRKHPKQVSLVISPDICFVIDNLEDADFNLKLPQFTLSRHKEILRLLEKRIFKLVNPKDVPIDIRVFNSRFVDEIKNAGTNKAFEKSRLVI